MPSPLSANVDYIYTADVGPYDPAIPGNITERWSDRPVWFNANDAALPNTQFRAWMTQPLTSKRSMFGSPASGSTASAQGMIGGLIGGVALPTQAGIELTVGDEFAAKRAYYKTLTWGGWLVKVYRHVKGAAASTRQLLLSGTFAAEPDFQKTKVSLPVSDMALKLQQIFAQSTYSGAGGFNGGSNIQGQYKPDAVGVCQGVEGVWVDTANGWVDYCASGFHTVDQVTDGASILTADVTNPPAAGKYYVDLANGRLRFGSPATYTYRVNFTSAFASNATTIADIVSALLTRAGYAGGDIDSAAFTALNSSRGEKVGMYCQSGETFQDVVNFLVAGAMCFLTSDPSNGGKITIGKVTAPTAVASTDSSVAWVITDRDIVPNSFKRTGTLPPPYRLDISGAKNWRVLSDNQIAAGALTADKDFARQQWRIVSKTNADTPSTQTKYPLSVPMALLTPFTDLTQLSSVGDEWKTLFTVARPTAEVTVAAAPFSLKMGAQVWIQSTVNEVNAPGIVASIDESANSNQVKIQLWSLNG